MTTSNAMKSSRWDYFWAAVALMMGWILCAGTLQALHAAPTTLPPVTVKTVGYNTATLQLVFANTNELNAFLASNGIARVNTDSLPRSGALAMLGVMDMGGFSITNVDTNSIGFANGTYLGATSTALTFKAAAGTNYLPIAMQSEVAEVEAALPTVDPLTLTQTGTRIKVTDWIPDNLMNLWYEVNLASLTAGGGFIDGPGYTFNDENGILADRSSGYSWTGNGYTHAPGEAAVFTGTEVLWNTVEGVFGVGLSNFTISVWLYRTDDEATYTGAMGQGRADDGYAFLYGIRSGVSCGQNIFFDHSGWNPPDPVNFDIDTGIFLPLNEWIHFAMVIEAYTQQTYYANGIEVLRTEYDFNTNFYTYVPTTSFQIGGYGGFPGGSEQPWIGKIDEVGLWERALASNEVFSLAQPATAFITGAITNGIVGLYHFDNAASNTFGPAIESIPEGGVSFAEGTVADPTRILEMVIVSTNALLTFVASNALPTFISDTVGLTTNLVRVGVYDVRNNVTNWGGNLVQVSAAGSTDYMYRAAGMSFPGMTNASAIVWLSSNSTAVIKGVAVPCAP